VARGTELTDDGRVAAEYAAETLIRMRVFLKSLSK
jgi:hypothetical protein